MLIKQIILALSVVLLSAGVSAAEGFYVNGGVGFGQVEDSDFDDNTVGWRVLGGYQFSENFALEAGYADLGEAEDSIFGVDVEAELDAVTLSVLGLLPLSDQWAAFGKLGYYDGEAEVEAFGLEASDDESGVLVGAGVRYDFSDELAVRGEVDWYDTDLDRVWAIVLSLQFTFPK